MADEDFLTPPEKVPILAPSKLKHYRGDIRHQLTRAMHQVDELWLTIGMLDSLLATGGGRLGHGLTDVPRDVILSFVEMLVDEYSGPDGIDGVRPSMADVDVFISGCRLAADRARQEQMDELRAMNPNAIFPPTNGHDHGGPPCPSKTS